MIGSLNTCNACKVEFTGLPSELLCPDCSEDALIWKNVRGKGMPREFLPYVKIWEQWMNRRDDCKEFRKLVKEANKVLIRNKFLEADNAALRSTIGVDTEELAAENLRLKTEVERAKKYADFCRGQLERLQDENVKRSVAQSRLSGIDPPPINEHLLRQLRSLCHPDRWASLPQEKTATEVMQWLNGLN